MMKKWFGILLMVCLSVAMACEGVAAGEELLSITPPAAVTGIENGLTAEEINGLLPKRVAILTNTQDTMAASVKWNVPASDYDPFNPEPQTFDVEGNVTLPDGVSDRKSVV